MAEPVKVKFEYKNPDNVEAEVPGTQNLREAQSNGDNAENTESKPKMTTRISSYTEAHSEVIEDGKVTSRHLVMTTIGQDKSEDKKAKTKIPVSRFRQTVEKVKAQRRQASQENESHIPIRKSSIPKPPRNSKLPASVRREVTVTKTEVTQKITAPEDEFDKLYEEVVNNASTDEIINVGSLSPKIEDPDKLESKFEEIIHDYDDNKVQPIDVEKVKRSKIPFLRRKSQQDTDVNTQADRNSRIILAREKLRMRHSSDQDSNDLKQKSKENQSKYVKQESRETVTNDTKQESNTTSPIDISNDETSPTSEVTRKYTKTIITTSSKNNEDDEYSKIVGTTTITEVKTDESSIQKEKLQGQLIEENIYKNSIKVGIPVFDSFVHEYTEKSETERTVEVKKVLSYTSNNGDIQIKEAKVETIEITEPNTVEITDVSDNFGDIKSDIVAEMQNEYTSNNGIQINEAKVETIEITEPTSVEITEISENYSDIKPEIVAEMQDTKQAIKEKDSVQDSAKLRGKVGTFISRIDSHEPDREQSKMDASTELPKRKSVMSKIAMFERYEAEPVIPKPKVTYCTKKQIKLPKLQTTTLKTEHIHVHTPLIVEEVLKPFQATIDLNVDVNKVDITTNGEKDHAIETSKAEMVVINAPESVCEVESKVLFESNILTIQDTKVEEEVFTPVPEKLEVRDEDVKNDIAKELATKTEEVSKVPAVVSNYVPVRERLFRLESLNDQRDDRKETSVGNKVVENLPLIPTKIDYTPEEIVYKPDEDMKSNGINKKDESDSDVFAAENEKNYYSLDYNQVFQNDKTKYGFKSEINGLDEDYKIWRAKDDDLRRAKSLVELDLGDAVKGKVNRMIVRINSVDKVGVEMKEVPIDLKEMPRKRSVSEKIALFERKLTPAKEFRPPRFQKLGRTEQKKPVIIEVIQNTEVKTSPKDWRSIQNTEKQRTEAQIMDRTEQKELETEDIQQKIAELVNAKTKYGAMEVPKIELVNGITMPLLAVGTAQLDPRLAFHIITAAIDLGYRAIDTAFIYGNEKVVGEAIRAKIADGTVTRAELFVISKLWSTFHRADLVPAACQASLDAMGLDYFDLYLIHNPMSFKEGGAPIPKIATVLQYSESDFLDAWFGLETLGARTRALGVSNFNSGQLKRVLDRARVKPVVNQVECHPYLSQQRLDQFCSERNITLSCFGVLGSKETPRELKSGHPTAIDDALVQVMASGLDVTPAQLLIRYQIECGHQVVVKASTAAHLWDNLQALTFSLTSGQVDALHALNRNKRIFTFKGMGDTHKNYPFNIAF